MNTKLPPQSRVMRAVAVACAMLLTTMTFHAFAQQAPGSPQAVGDNVGRVGGYKPADPQQQAPVVSPAMQALQQGRPTAPPQSLQSAQPGRPLSAAPAPSQYPRAGAMPSPEINLVNEAVDQVAPMSPQDIVRLREMLADRHDAFTQNVPGRPIAKAKSRIETLDLSPNAEPPAVHIEVNRGSIVSFVDASGKPWPVRVADGFAPKALTLSQFTEHQLSIGTGSVNPINVSVAVALEGLPTAVTFSVMSGQTDVDSQATFVIPKYRDGVPPEVGALGGQPSLNSRDLVDFLLRTPPKEARPLTVEGVPGVMAWQTSSTRMVIRSTAKVASGYFRGHQGVGDGTEVYEVPLSPQVSFISGDRMVFAKISGFAVGTFAGAK